VGKGTPCSLKTRKSKNRRKTIRIYDENKDLTTKRRQIIHKIEMSYQKETKIQANKAVRICWEKGIYEATRDNPFINLYTR